MPQCITHRELSAGQVYGAAQKLLTQNNFVYSMGYREKLKLKIVTHTNNLSLSFSMFAPKHGKSEYFPQLFI